MRRRELLLGLGASGLVRAAAAGTLPLVGAGKAPGGGGGGYTAKAVEFAANSGLLCDPLALADSSVFSGSLWVNMSPDDYNDDDEMFVIQYTHGAGRGRVLLDQFIPADATQIGIQSASDPISGVNTFNFRNDSGTFVPDTWFNYRFSVDYNHPSGSRLFTSFLGSNSVSAIDLDNGNAYSLVLTGLSAKLAGAYPGAIRFADVWYTTSHYIDWADAATSAKFINGSGKPVDLGADGSTPFGYVPEFFFTGNAASFVGNQGASVFTLIGSAPTDYSPGPSA